jgi:hypothetical protein
MEQRIKIDHQLLHQPFFIPAWPVKYLFVGTFNPNGGEYVNYYYGRKGNHTWPTLSKIFKEEFLPENASFLSKIELHGIACMDLILSIETSIERKHLVCGKGYKDSNIINTVTDRIYNCEKINEVINNNSGIKVFSTWGKGSTLSEWLLAVQKIPHLVHLVSPSNAARVPKGSRKEEFIFNNWLNLIRAS